MAWTACRTRVWFLLSFSTIAFVGIESIETVPTTSVNHTQPCGGTLAPWASNEVKSAVRESVRRFRASGDSLYTTIVRAHKRVGTFETSKGQFYETAARAAWYLVRADPADHLARLEYGILLYFVAHSDPYPKPWKTEHVERPFELGLVDAVTLREAESQLACAARLAGASGDEVVRIRADSMIHLVRQILREHR